MNLLDIAIAAVLAVFSIYGLLRGFARIAIGLSGLAVSLALALRFSGRGNDWFGGVIESPELAMLVAFVLLLLAGLALTGVVAWVVWRIVKAAHVDWLDRLAGFAVGLVGALLVVSGALVALTTFLPGGAPILAESRLIPLAIRVADLAATVLPEELAATYRERRRILDDSVRGVDEAARAEPASPGAG